MPALLRSVGPRGPRFYIDRMDGEQVIMFTNVIDSCTSYPPRLATTEDAEAFPEAWAKLEADKGDDAPNTKPLVTFETPPDAEIPAPTKAKGEKAPA